MRTLAPIIDSQYRDDRTYPKPKPRDTPRVSFYERGRVDVVVIEAAPAEKSGGAS